jgi:hypothetical protein
VDAVGTVRENRSQKISDVRLRKFDLVLQAMETLVWFESEMSASGSCV